MKNQNRSHKPVTLEPELERIAANWLPAKRLVISRKLRRWARQLEVSAFILAQKPGCPRERFLRKLPLRIIATN